MKSILPIILIVLVLTGAIAYSLSKRSQPQKPIDNHGLSANQLKNDTLTPTPSVTKNGTFFTPSLTPTVTLPVVTEKNTVKTSTAKIATATVTKITKTTICTPVYGSADTCTEHVVVDTGVEDALFFNFAGLAYLGGLASFVKAKSLKR